MHGVGTMGHSKTSLSLASLFALLLWSAASAQERPDSPAPSKPAPITLAANRVSFVPPPGFTALSAEWLALKYPNPGAPRHAVGNPRRTVSIAYDVLDGAVPSKDLEALRAMQMQGLSQLPKVKWVASEVRRISNHEWVYQEFVSAAADQDIHNILLLTVVDDRLALFNFNSTVADFPRVESELRRAIASIKVVP